jgi:glycosyltransferase involved in cell wall biosynthesis
VRGIAAVIGVIVPAHNEATLIGRALEALRVAAAHEGLGGEEVQILAVLDACSDQTGEIAGILGIECVSINARNVGLARAAGAKTLIDRGARWLAFTDADSKVDPCWLSQQLALRSEAVCGVVEVDDWSSFTDEQRRAYELSYCDAEGHSHIHGANLGVCAKAYQLAGGFPPTTCDEDIALVTRLQSLGASIAWTNSVRVWTSARLTARAPNGFAAVMNALGVKHGALPASA